MYASDIQSVLGVIKEFGGVKAADEISTVNGNIPPFFIFNTDPAHLPGTHWVAMYVNNNVPEFFDSIGKPPSYYHKSFEYLLVNRGPAYRYNSQRLQGRDSEMCGQYCVYYVWMRNRGYSMKEIVNSFSENLAHNDKIVSQFYNKLLRRVN